MMEMQILRGTSATESNSMPFTFPCSTLIMNRAILFAKEHVYYNKPSVGTVFRDLSSYLPGKTADSTTDALEISRVDESCIGMPGQSLHIGATSVGYGCDNPSSSQISETIDASNPGKCQFNNYWKKNKQTINQGDKAIELAFSETSSFQILIDISCSRTPAWRCNRDGRNVIFGGSKTCTSGTQTERRRMEEENDSYMHFWAKELMFYSEAA